MAGLLVVVVALAGGACSDDDPDAPTPSTEAETEALEADFSYEVELAEGGPTNCPVAEIRFSDESRGGPTAWEWEFSDHTTSTEQDPVVGHELNEATLTVRRGDERATVTRPVSFAVC